MDALFSFLDGLDATIPNQSIVIPTTVQPTVAPPPRPSTPPKSTRFNYLESFTSPTVLEPFPRVLTPVPPLSAPPGAYAALGVHTLGPSASLPLPVTDFAATGLAPAGLMLMRQQGWVRPTPIQATALACLLGGHDARLCATTGSGKTLAYIVPAVMHALACGPYSVLVLAPTRELALQIHRAASLLTNTLGLRTALLIGGTDVGAGVSALAARPHLVVATPARALAAFGRSKETAGQLGSVSMVVIDEADRMEDCGFAPQIEMLLRVVRKDARKIQVSATFAKPAPGELVLVAQGAGGPITDEMIAQMTSSDTGAGAGAGAVAGDVGEGTGSAAPHIDQRVRCLTTEDDKLPTVVAVLREWGALPLAPPSQAGAGAARAPPMSFTQVLLFANTQESAAAVCAHLRLAGAVAAAAPTASPASAARGPTCGCVHGALDNAAREQLLDDFRSGQLRLLVSTSLGARGIDLPGLGHVLLVDAPVERTDYIHRVGRTGRAGAPGTALTIVTPADVAEGAPTVLATELRRAGRPVPVRLQVLADAHRARVRLGTGRAVGGGLRGRGFKFTEADDARVAAAGVAGSELLSAVQAVVDLLAIPADSSALGGDTIPLSTLPEQIRLRFSRRNALDSVEQTFGVKVLLKGVFGAAAGAGEALHLRITSDDVEAVRKAKTWIQDEIRRMS